MKREDLTTRVLVFLFQVGMHVGMIALFGWLFYKVGTAYNIFDTHAWYGLFTWVVCSFFGLVVTNIIGSAAEKK